ncbi:2-oxo acid dehydrogenase subunit E2 [Halopseudomonas sp. SMJS2]|uniref:2-oxo acid dehydrogenase subunit E2 n=1 Tax=Halopseudomonas sp. SMJS2 TaxID=3041098 RepID=UPI0024535301|nr:2-oxo acid dehydrogenase subunit E2 [Halopseudomonas sp. SMJS2]WGK62477.1 2-oxo acid dehydrogenase subunit E2 [Halopseudomonas sp. SMJS2]
MSSTPTKVWPATLPPMPEVDFSQFGEFELAELSRHQQYAGAFLARNWAQIPHVTHNDEAPVDALNAFRRDYGKEIGRKLTSLPFLVKALVNTLEEFPVFNSSISSDGKQLVMKQYFNVGIAVETDKGLLVPVIRDADKKSLSELTDELIDKASRARAKGLPIGEMSGGCMTISSLGSIGGTSFTPIINAPEVAILGITREFERVVLVGGEVSTRRYVPLSLSYDHRVINGADAARFCRFYAGQLEHPERLI